MLELKFQRTLSWLKKKTKQLSAATNMIINKLTVKWEPPRRGRLTAAHNGVAHGILKGWGVYNIKSKISDITERILKYPKHRKSLKINQCC